MEKEAKCRRREEFDFDELHESVTDQYLDGDSECLLRLIRLLGPADIVYMVRMHYYLHAGTHNWDETAPDFWESVADHLKDDTISSKENQVLDNACVHGLYPYGVELFTRIYRWFSVNDFIRSDITKASCDLFEYLDTECFRTDIIQYLFDEKYEDVDVETARATVMEFLEKRLPIYQFAAFKSEVERLALEDEDQIYADLTEWEDVLLAMAERNINLFEDKILDMIFLH